MTWRKLKFSGEKKNAQKLLIPKHSLCTLYQTSILYPKKKINFCQLKLFQPYSTEDFPNSILCQNVRFFVRENSIFGQKIVLLEQCDSPSRVFNEVLLLSWTKHQSGIIFQRSSSSTLPNWTTRCTSTQQYTIAAMGIEQYTGKKPICDTHKVCQGERRTMTNIRNGMMTTQFSTKVLYLGGIRVANFRCLMRSKPMGNIFSIVTPLIKEKASQAYQLVLVSQLLGHANQ